MATENGPGNADKAGEDSSSHSAGNVSAAAVRSIESRLNSGDERYVTNFDGDKMHQWRLVSLATGGECLGFKDMPEDGIDLKYFYCHRIEMVSSRDGEVIDPIRTALITTDGKAYGFVSDFIAREIDTIRQMWGEGPWNPPLKVRVVKFQTRKGQQCYSIKPV